MEPEPDHDPEHDGPCDREPSQGAARPDDEGAPGGPASGSPGSPGSMDASGAVGGEDDGSDFGSQEDLEGSLAAAREREELLAGSPRAGCGISARRARSSPRRSRGRVAPIGGAGPRSARS